MPIKARPLCIALLAALALPTTALAAQPDQLPASARVSAAPDIPTIAVQYPLVFW